MEFLIQRNEMHTLEKRLRELQRATAGYWVGGATRQNGGRPTYRTPEGTYRAVDRTYGPFEAHDQRGRHQGQESIDGELDTD